MKSGTHDCVMGFVSAFEFNMSLELVVHQKLNLERSFMHDLSILFNVMRQNWISKEDGYLMGDPCSFL